MNFDKIKKNIPNLVTCLNLLSGALACVFAFRCNDVIFFSLKGYEVAFIMIALGALFDFCDGLVARLLNVSSVMGKELDSLSDCVSFGMAPAILIFSIMHTNQPESWLCYLALIIPVFGALRLARFNVDTNQTTTFTGMPIPANAIFWIGFSAWYTNHLAISQWVVVPFIFATSYLMVSNIRMFSLKLKNFKFKENVKVYFLAIAAVIFISTAGLAGLAWTIIFYVLASLIATTE